MLSAGSQLKNFDACNAHADVAMAGATCGDGSGEEEASAGTATTANNSDDSERWPWPAVAGRRRPAAMAARTGALPPGTWP